MARRFLQKGGLWTTTNWQLRKHGGRASMAQSSRRLKEKFRPRSLNGLRTNRRRKAKESIRLPASSAPKPLTRLSNRNVKLDAGGWQLVSRRLSITSFG